MASERYAFSQVMYEAKLANGYRIGAQMPI